MLQNAISFPTAPEGGVGATGTRVSGTGEEATGAAGIGVRLGPPAKGVTGGSGEVPGLAGAAYTR